MPARHQQHGNTLLEFVFILPIFVLIVGAIMEFGWFFYEHNILMMAVRAGCIEGGHIHADADPVSAAETAILENLTAASFRCPTGDCQPDVAVNGSSPMEVLACSVVVHYEPVVAVVPGMDDVDLRASTMVRLELQR